MNRLKNILKGIKKVVLIALGLMILVIDYIVYTLDGVLVALFPRSYPSFRGWQGKKYDNNFKRYSYIRIVTLAIIGNVIALIYYW